MDKEEEKETGMEAKKVEEETVKTGAMEEVEEE